MHGQFQCKICGGQSITTVNSYKHLWRSCNDCGNVFRQRKERYLAPQIIPLRISKFLFPKVIIEKLYPIKEVIQDEKQFYNYYNEASLLDITKTKWGAQLNGIMNNLMKYNIDPGQKYVLDISGGPGFVIKEMAGVAAKAVVTEFSETAVEGMRKNLGINAVKFDYNSDDISQILTEKFDLVFINYSINFCQDLSKFIRSLKKILKPGSYVYISFNSPSLGFFMRWQFDEYTCNVLYQPETMLRMFMENGFTLVDKWADGSYCYTVKRPLIFKLFVLPYVFMAMRRNMNINRELINKTWTHLYQLR